MRNICIETLNFGKQPMNFVSVFLLIAKRVTIGPLVLGFKALFFAIVASRLASEKELFLLPQLCNDGDICL
jgi:hypothetical protein